MRRGRFIPHDQRSNRDLTFALIPVKVSRGPRGKSKTKKAS